MWSRASPYADGRKRYRGYASSYTRLLDCLSSAWWHSRSPLSFFLWIACYAKWSSERLHRRAPSHTRRVSHYIFTHTPV